MRVRLAWSILAALLLVAFTSAGACAEKTELIPFPEGEVFSISESVIADP